MSRAWVALDQVVPHLTGPMPKTLFKVDLTKPMDQQEMPGHNRWHPDIPAVASVNPGDV